MHGSEKSPQDTIFCPPQSSEPMIRITDDFLLAPDINLEKEAELLLKPVRCFNLQIFGDSKRDGGVL